MPNSQPDIKEIKNKIIRGLICQYLPMLIVGIFESQLESTPGMKLLGSLFSVIALVFFFYGYVVCADATDDYAGYKGYRNFCFIYSIFNVFGLSILFLLKNKSKAGVDDIDRDPLDSFSISAIFYSYLAIPIVLMPLHYIPGLIIMGAEFVEYAKDDVDFNAFSNFIISIPIAWYFFREMRRANLDRKTIFGSLKKIDLKLPIGLAIIRFIFAEGINNITLYGLSFLFPKYLEYLIDKEYATEPLGWIFTIIGSLIYAPIMEELFFRGIIFQKVTISRNISWGLSVSAIAFALIHFRFDLISLYTGGIIYAILYFKTKMLFTPIICHFTYNLIVLSERLYFQIFPDLDSTQATVLEYQQHVRDNLGMYALFLAISIPYLSYFIYKNFPHNRDIDKLPYFVNR